MSEKDWWSGLYDDQGQLPGPDGANADLVTVSPENSGVNTSGQRFGTPAHNWGSGHAPDPFLQENPPLGNGFTGNTPEEAAELRKHDRPKGGDPEEVKADIPPIPPPDPPKEETKPTPDTPSTSPADAPEEEPKGNLKGLKEKATAARKKTGEAVARTEPARQKAHVAADAVSASFSGSWSLLWCMAVAWTVAVTFPLALIDRIAMIFGSPRPVFGDERMDWGFLHGPGVWFGQQLDAYGASGNIGRLVLLCAIGAVPVLFAQLGEKINNDRMRKLTGWIAYGFPVFFVCMPYYFDSMGFRSAGELYLTALAASAWWGFSFSRTLETGFFRFILRIPLAAVIVGLGHYAPGAAF